MEKPQIDPKRTNVPAIFSMWTEPPLFLIDSRWYGPYGTMIPRYKDDLIIDHLICCPGCGQVGGPKEGAKWTVIEGSREDVTTMTLNPSIAKSCCGWHGYLKKGIFVSC